VEVSASRRGPKWSPLHPPRSDADTYGAFVELEIEEFAFFLCSTMSVFAVAAIQRLESLGVSFVVC
jgi:hypothetical protein